MISQINLPDSKVRISAFGVPLFSGIQTLFGMSKKKVIGHQDAMLCGGYTTYTVQNKSKLCEILDHFVQEYPILAWSRIYPPPLVG